MPKKKLLRMENNEIKAEEFMEEIQLLLKDHYVAKFYRQGQELNITFLNGQKFTLSLYEIRRRI